VDPLIGVRILGHIKKWTMELIYFISGILTVGTVYGVLLLRNVKFSHTDLVERLQSQSNISSIQYGKVIEEYEEIKTMAVGIQNTMKKDHYITSAELNKKIDTVHQTSRANSTQQKESNKVFNQNINDLHTKISQLNFLIQSNKEDPDVLDRYGQR